MKPQARLVLLLVGLFLTACLAQPTTSVPPLQATPMSTTTSVPPSQVAPTKPVVAAVVTDVIGVEPVDPKSSGLSIQPPAAKLHVGEQTQTAGIGTYCWKSQSKSSGPAGLCADMIGIPTAKDAVRVQSPVPLQFEIPVNGQPAELLLTVITAASTKEKTEPNSPYRWWDFAEGQQHQLELSNSPSVEVQLQPGLYVLDLFARWDDGNDASYGFLVNVE